MVWSVSLYMNGYQVLEEGRCYIKSCDMPTKGCDMSTKGVCHVFTSDLGK